MKHCGRVSVVCPDQFRGGAGAPGRADAKGDFMNAVWKAWQDYIYAKKNEVRLS